MEGSIDLRDGTTRDLQLSLVVDNLGSDRAVPTMGNAEAHAKQKKITKQLSQMLDLKKQANIMAGCCIIAMSFFYLCC